MQFQIYSADETVWIKIGDQLISVFLQNDLLKTIITNDKTPNEHKEIIGSYPPIIIKKAKTS